MSFRGKFTLKESDHGWKRIQAEIERLKKANAHVRVGVFGKKDPRKDGKVGNVQLAAIHEYGTDRIPERSFIRSTFYARRDLYLKMLKELIKSAVLGGSGNMRQAFGFIGQRMSADMKLAITSGAGIPPPNAPSVYERKRRKNSNGLEPRTLVDTGQLVRSISYEVHGV